MATGRIGVTPNLRTRWSKAPAGGTTSLSGLDDNSVSLVYDAGFEAVYRNGVLLSRGNDYTATNGTTITLIDATIAGDIIEVFANQAIPLTSTYTQAVADSKFINNTLVDAKGDILTATAADTPARLAVGSNDQVLTADSSTATGLKWATPAAGGWTSIASGTLSGTSVSMQSISGTYYELILYINNPYVNSATTLGLRCNNDANTVYSSTWTYVDTSSWSNVSGNSQIDFYVASNAGRNLPTTAQNVSAFVRLPNYAASSGYKVFELGGWSDNASWGGGAGGFGISHYEGGSGAITRLDIRTGNGTSTFSGGTYALYGLK